MECHISKCSFDLKDAKSRAGDSKKNGQVEVLEVTLGLSWLMFLTCIYSEALKVADAEYLPKMMMLQFMIYYQDLIQQFSLQGGGMGFGTADLIYSNNTGSWVKFFKSKLGMRLSCKSAKSKAAVESAAASAFTSNADNATLPMR